MRRSTSRILITGGAGFVGVTLARKFIERGHGVIVYDDFSNPSGEQIPKKARVIEASVMDLSTLFDSLYNCDACVHLAAKTSVVDSVKYPSAYLETNTVGTYNVLETCRAAHVGQTIIASSGAADKITSPYGASKASAEAFAEAYAKSYKMNVACLRFANAYGPGSARKTSVVAKWMKAIENEQPVIIYGDGEQTRDFVSVNDVCDAIVRVTTMGLPGYFCGSVDTGVITSVNELHEILQGVTGLQIQSEQRPERAGEIKHVVAKAVSLRTTGMYEPKIALADGLRETWNYFKQVAV